MTTCFTEIKKQAVLSVHSFSFGVRLGFDSEAIVICSFVRIVILLRRSENNTNQLNKMFNVSTQENNTKEID